jgi:hypothetical protein
MVAIAATSGVLDVLASMSGRSGAVMVIMASSIFSG